MKILSIQNLVKHGGRNFLSFRLIQVLQWKFWKGNKCVDCLDWEASYLMRIEFLEIDFRFFSNTRVCVVLFEALSRIFSGDIKVRIVDFAKESFMIGSKSIFTTSRSIDTHFTCDFYQVFNIS